MYSLSQTSLWPSIARVVPLAQVGFANGIGAGLQGLNIGVTNLGIGKLLGFVEEYVHNKYWNLTTLILAVLHILIRLLIWLSCFAYIVLTVTVIDDYKFLSKTWFSIECPLRFLRVVKLESRCEQEFFHLVIYACYEFLTAWLSPCKWHSSEWIGAYK